MLCGVIDAIKSSVCAQDCCKEYSIEVKGQAKGSRLLNFPYSIFRFNYSASYSSFKVKSKYIVD